MNKIIKLKENDVIPDRAKFLYAKKARQALEKIKE